MIERRSRPRVAFPAGTAPVFVIGDRPYRVLDCSEHGLRYEITRGSRPSLASLVEGTLRLPSGQEIHVEGSVAWTTSSSVALHLTEPGIPPDALAEALKI